MCACGGGAAAYQVGNSPIKAQLRDLHITAAKLVEVDGGKKAIVMFVPFRLLQKYHKIQKALVEELEKKFRCVRRWCGRGMRRCRRRLWLARGRLGRASPCFPRRPHG